MRLTCYLTHFANFWNLQKLRICVEMQQKRQRWYVKEQRLFTHNQLLICNILLSCRGVTFYEIHRLVKMIKKKKKNQKIRVQRTEVLHRIYYLKKVFHRIYNNTWKLWLNLKKNYSIEYTDIREKVSLN